jgi:hypothetical protein
MAQLAAPEIERRAERERDGGVRPPGRARPGGLMGWRRASGSGRGLHAMRISCIPGTRTKLCAKLDAEGAASVAATLQALAAPPGC